jgi:hypothetical protein
MLMEIQPVPFLINRAQAENLGLPPDEANRSALLGLLAAPTPVLGLVLTRFLAEREIARLQAEAPPPEPATPANPVPPTSPAPPATPGTPWLPITPEFVDLTVTKALQPVQAKVGGLETHANALEKRMAAVEKKLAPASGGSTK